MHAERFVFSVSMTLIVFVIFLMCFISAILSGSTVILLYSISIARKFGRKTQKFVNATLLKFAA